MIVQTPRMPNKGYFLRPFDLKGIGELDACGREIVCGKPAASKPSEILFGSMPLLSGGSIPGWAWAAGGAALALILFRRSK